MPTNPYPPGTPENPFNCGQPGQQPCPQKPAGADWTSPLYSHEDMLRHGQAAYDKGRAEALAEK